MGESYSGIRALADFIRDVAKYQQRLRATRELLLLDNDEPATYAEAMGDPDSEKWQDAMKFEIESMKENRVWNCDTPAYR